MSTATESDDELLASLEPGSFAVFYRRHVEDLVAFFMRRTRDAELAADLTAETFAAALGGAGGVAGGGRSGRGRRGRAETSEPATRVRGAAGGGEVTAGDIGPP